MKYQDAVRRFPGWRVCANRAIVDYEQVLVEEARQTLWVHPKRFGEWQAQALWFDT